MGNDHKTLGGTVESTEEHSFLSSHSHRGQHERLKLARVDSASTDSECMGTCEFIDSQELARRWDVPVSWIRDQVRSRVQDPLPHVNFGKYVRFLWGSPELEQWLARRIVVGNNRRVERVQ